MSAIPTPNPRLDVLLGTTSFPLDAADWKGRFIHDLAAALDRTGQVGVTLWGPPGELPGRVTSANSDSDTRWLQRMADEGGIAHLLRRRPVNGLVRAAGVLTRLRAACRRRQVDVYHVNWLQLALALPADRRPAYVAVLGSDFGLLRVPGMAGLLRRAFARRQTLLAPNAHWMSAPLAAQFEGVAEVRTNPFGVAPGWFEVKRSPATHREWLVVSRITRNKMGDLFDWGRDLFSAGRRLRLLGPMQEQVALPEWIDYEGPTNPTVLREHWFPRAAGLLTLSRHDEGRPQVMIEAMAAGLPVVASRIAAHADLIRDGETGWLVDDRRQLQQALDRAESTTVADEVGARARTAIRKEIGTWDDHAARCLSAYHDLLARESRHAA